MTDLAVKLTAKIQSNEEIALLDVLESDSAANAWMNAKVVTLALTKRNRLSNRSLHKSGEQIFIARVFGGKHSFQRLTIFAHLLEVAFEG